MSTDPQTPPEQPQEQQIAIDAVAAYFQKRMNAAEQDALILAARNRDLIDIVRRQQALLQQQEEALGEELADAAPQKKTKPKG
ncbi:hypothetical protein GRZ55_11545 [Chelativorans sp. ZYF759]|uniref:hypothetical protein n=1 Tax=Chelativorans sp. ZYF759 TaxID=2692213 RepID=UPI00145EF40B|nr:hypothetical protein [Chelativorans sp. ZYF759]NMG39877.1 hypothetical protein [Chelativorans sp. ZYF759]